MKVQMWCKVLLLIGFTVAFCNGCWDRKDFNQLAIAQAAAIDYENQQYQLTVQLIMPNAIEETVSSDSLWILEGSGESVGDALEQLSLRAPREIYLDHLDIVLLGEGLLQHDIGEGLEYLMKQSVLRRRTSLLATEGRAGDVLQAKAELADVDIYYLSNLIRDQNRRVKKSETMINDYYLTMNNEIAEGLLIPKVEVEDQKAIGLQGAAMVFDKQLLNWADQAWLRNYHWFTGGKEIIRLSEQGQDSGADGYDVTVELQKSKCKWELLSEQPLQIRAKLKALLYVTDNEMQDGNQTLEEIEAFHDKIQNALEQQVTQQLEAYLAQLQQEKFDALHLGRWLHAWHPDLVQGEQWPEWFSQAKIELQLETKVQLYELK